MQRAYENGVAINCRNCASRGKERRGCRAIKIKEGWSYLIYAFRVSFVPRMNSAGNKKHRSDVRASTVSPFVLVETLHSFFSESSSPRCTPEERGENRPRRKAKSGKVWSSSRNGVRNPDFPQPQIGAIVFSFKLAREKSLRRWQAKGEIVWGYRDRKGTVRRIPIQKLKRCMIDEVEMAEKQTGKGSR